MNLQTGQVMKQQITLFSILLFISGMMYGQNSTETLINSALKAAPENKREGATVIAIDEEGNTRVIREGTNDLVCHADDPTRDGFTVACYHKDLEEFMARGRELRKGGMGFREIISTRSEEIEAGTLSIPDKSTLHIVTGDGYDAEKDSVINEYKRWVIYIPNATSESTGLAERPSVPGEPWIMFPGTVLAHIMISPPK